MYYSLLGQLDHSLSCLVISVDVTSKPGVHFSDGNLAYGKKLRVFSRPEEVRSLNFLDVMESLGSNIARAAEVLIPDMVEIAHIRKVCVTDQGVIDSLPAAPIGISYHRLSW